MNPIKKAPNNKNNSDTKPKRIELSLIVSRIIFPNMMYNPTLSMQAGFASKIMQKMLSKKQGV